MTLLDPHRLSPPGRFGPLADDHPSVGEICFVCDKPLEGGQVPSLYSEGPATREDREKMLAGRAYNATASIIHESCAYPAEDARLLARRAANLVPVDITPADTCRIADAVSDVWEPQVNRLKGALRAAGVAERLVEEIARG